MTDQPTDAAIEAATALGENMQKLGAQWQRLFQLYMQQLGDTEKVPFDPTSVGQAFMRMSTQMLTNPQRLAEAQTALWRQYATLWQNAIQGDAAEPVAAPEKGDRRFKDAEWNENQVFDLLKQSYLITSRWLQKTVGEVDGLDDATRHKVDFYTRQFVDAMSPTNFFHTNPEVIRTTLETQGANLVSGLDNLIDDLESGKGIRQTDFDSFEVGKNLASTPGKVVFQNRLFQLIQYAPTTQETRELPLLICPPWINKYYILDLKPENSFVAWAVAQGFTVFMVSWVNPDQSYAETSFEDYMNEGLVAAMEATLKATGQSKLNVIGYCVGGTLLATTLSVLAAKGDDRVNAATFFTSLVDFEEAGDLSVFIDEEQLKLLDEDMGESGVLNGRRIASAFNMMRANDLIWCFVVNNYLLGKDPIPFDLLFWNADGTNMPHAMHAYYLRNMYLKNLLAKPGALEMNGVPVDLRKIEVPTYILSTKEDHIAPWTSCYRLPQLIGGAKRFVLAQSGHVAGVVSAPGKTKYGHWTNSTLPKDPQAWLASATEVKGSWWPDWAAWLAKRSGKEVPARDPSKGPLKPIEDAPGSYVKNAIDD
ncbi:MAG: class I poly(R)-hydroxyalkanoic acid synthase [Alphaproteobacteria bacterium]